MLISAKISQNLNIEDWRSDDMKYLFFFVVFILIILYGCSYNVRTERIHRNFSTTEWRNCFESCKKDKMECVNYCRKTLHQKRLNKNWR